MASFLQGRGRGGSKGYGPLGPVIKGVAAGIGLASEGIHHYRENKAAKAVPPPLSEEKSTSGLSPPPYERQMSTGSTSETDLKTPDIHTIDVTDEDERQWELDEAQDELNSTEETGQRSAGRPSEHDPKKMVKHFTDAHPAPVGVMQGGLQLPVILPQRRPKDRTRGFIRAYAPVLQDCGIDQPMFMDFLDTFNQATLASPWLDAINLASFAFMVLPTAIGQAASIALAIAVDITKNMQSRHRHSYVLDQMNNDFYRPRGLYALILTWNPAVEDTSIGINLNETIGENLNQPQGLAAKTKHSFRPSMGNTNGVVFTETAPLIFPTLESLTESSHHEVKTNKEKLVLTKSLVADYFDRRAQASYAGENPDSDLLVAPKPKFTSRYSDPNHPSNSGSLLGLVTGGKVVLPPPGQRLSALRSLSNSSSNSGGAPQTYQEQDQSPYGVDRIIGDRRALMQSRSDSNPGGPAGLIGATVGRVLKKHVLYLMIVNMPSEMELAEATRHLSRVEAQGESQAWTGGKN